MPKTIEQMYTEKQARINAAIKKKEFRQSKTELNINFSWAVNNANNFLKEEDKGTAKGFRLIKKWYPKFIELYREWALENIPIEPTKITYEDIKEAVKEAPQSQTTQEQAEELGAEKLEEEKTREANESFELASQPTE